MSVIWEWLVVVKMLLCTQFIKVRKFYDETFSKCNMLTKAS